MIHYKQVQTSEELQQILELQQKNLPKNLTDGEMLKEGFLSIAHSFGLLQKMNDAAQHIIAMDHDKVIGFALSMHPRFGDEIALLKPMFREIYQAVSNTRFMVMGQICVAKAYRNQGIFKKLYSTMQHYLPMGYTKIITQVDAKNSRSMGAHSAAGFTELKRYFADGKEWSLIVLDKKTAPK